jgi:hypothetical protein
MILPRRSFSAFERPAARATSRRLEDLISDWDLDVERLGLARR